MTVGSQLYPDFSLTSKALTGTTYRWVKDLIAPDYTRWNLAALNELCNQEEVKEILKIPIGTKVGNDKVVWQFQKHGRYSVRSGYNRLKDQLDSNQQRNTGMQSQVPSPSLWKSIWALKVPPKVKFFIWRCMKNALATKTNLRRRGCSPDNTCPICHSAEETVEHALILCPTAQHVWFGLSLTYRPREIGFQSFERWWRKACDNFHREGLIEYMGLLATSCWQIWKSRNNEVFNQEAFDLRSTISNIINQWQEFKEAHFNTLEIRQASPSPPQVWRKPNQGMITINCDAAFTDSNTEA